MAKRSKEQDVDAAVRIVSFRAENFKRLVAIEITPDGNVVRITGRNGQGKSSVLDGIAATLGGKELVPKEPIRRGQDKAQTQAVLTNGVTVTRRYWRREGGDVASEIKVEADGRLYKTPQAFLDAMNGALWVDPFRFARMRDQERAELLRALVADFDFVQNASARAEAYAERTVQNRKAKDANAAAAAVRLPSGPLPQVEDLDALLTELGDAMRSNTETDRRRLAREQAAKDADRLEEDAEDLRARAADLEKKAEELRKKIAGATPLAEPIDVVPIRGRIDKARDGAALVDRAGERARYLNAASDATTKAVALTEQIEGLDAAKRAAIENANLPVPGLDLADDGVLLGELPFDQAGGAEKLAASVAIAMALNPTIKVLLVDEATGLDPDHLGLIAKMAAEQSYQLWMASVDTSGKVGITIEDGEVALASAGRVR